MKESSNKISKTQSKETTIKSCKGKHQITSKAEMADNKHLSSEFSLTTKALFQALKVTVN